MKFSPYIKHQAEVFGNLTFVRYSLQMPDHERLWIGETYQDKSPEEVESLAQDRCIVIYNDWMEKGGTVPFFDIYVAKD